MQDRQGQSSGGSHEDKKPWDGGYNSNHNKDWGDWRKYGRSNGLW